MILDRTTAILLADAIDKALGLESVIRYLDMFHWQEESAAYHRAAACETQPRLESVAAHTWHVTYIIGLLLPYFPELDARRVYEIATLHDVLELITGDYDPTGSDGQGTGAHSMDNAAANAKDTAERAALETYLVTLPAPVRELHRARIEEEMLGASDEARFVKVVDKMQSLVYIRAKKNGSLGADGLKFLMNYRAKTLPKFPALAPLYDELMARLQADSQHKMEQAS